MLMTLTTLGIAGSNGLQINEKLFGFLKSAEKCLKESNPELCVKRNLNAWCEKKRDRFPETHVCGCVDEDPRLVITKYTNSVIQPQ